MRVAHAIDSRRPSVAGMGPVRGGGYRAVGLAPSILRSRSAIASTTICMEVCEVRESLRALVTLALVFALAGLSVSCSGAGANEVKIGVSAPLTGSIPVVGRGTKYGAEMAAEEINAKGGLDVGGRKVKVKLIIEDSANDPKQTAVVFQKLITQDKVLGIIGDQASKCSMAGGPIAQSNGVPMITPWSTTDAVTAGKDYVFRACFCNSFQAPVMARYAIQKLGAKKGAVLFDIASDSLKDLAENFRKAFIAGGGEIVAYETYTTGDKDFSAQLTKIRATGPDVVYMASYYDEGGLQVKQAHSIGLNVPILGTDGWDSPELIQLGGADMEGILFTDHYAVDIAGDTAKVFISKYKTKYGFVPDAPAALTYDAAMLLFKAIEKAGKLDRKAVRDAMATMDYDGVTGKIKFEGGSGDPKKDVVIVQIKDGAFVFYDRVSP